MPIMLENPAGNTPQANDAAGPEQFRFAAAPEPGPTHMDGVVLLYSSLPAVQATHPAANVLLGNFNGNEIATSTSLEDPRGHEIAGGAVDGIVTVGGHETQVTVDLSILGGTQLDSCWVVDDPASPAVQLNIYIGMPDLLV